MWRQGANSEGFECRSLGASFRGTEDSEDTTKETNKAPMKEVRTGKFEGEGESSDHMCQTETNLVPGTSPHHTEDQFYTPHSGYRVQD